MQCMNDVHRSPIDLNLLPVFQAVWDTRSVTRAAEVLALTQSAVSHALRRLRAATGDPLFVPVRGGMVPTPIAEALIGPVGEAMAILAGALQRPVPFDPAMARRTLTLAGGDFVQFTFVPAVIERLAKEAPGIRLQVEPVPALPALVQRLSEGAIDLLVDLLPVKAPGVVSRPIGAIRLLTLVRAAEAPVGRRFPLKRYLSEPHVILEPRTRQGSIVDQTLAARGLVRQVGATVPNFSAMPAITARAGYLCNLPDRMARVYAPLFGLTAFAPPIDFPATPLYLAWPARSEADEAHAWFRSLVEAELAETGPGPD